MVKQNRWKILLLLENDCTSSLIVMVVPVKKFGFEIRFGQRPKIKKTFQIFGNGPFRNLISWRWERIDHDLSSKRDPNFCWCPGWMILHTNWGSDVTKFEQNDPSKFSSFDWSIQVATNVEIDQSFLPKQLFTKTG